MRQIFLVEAINGSDLSLFYCKSFVNKDKANDYFTYLIGKFQISDDGEYIDECISDGYCDFTDNDGFKISIIIKEITLMDDDFWASVPEDKKPEVLAAFYADLTDEQKDQFIRETGELVSNNIF